MMIPLSTVQIDSGGAESAQRTVAWVMLALVVIAVVVGKLYLRYWQLDDEQKRHMKAIRPSLVRSKWHSIPVSAMEDRGPRYRRVLEVAYGDRDTRRRAKLQSVKAGISSQLPTMPGIALRGAFEGVAILFLGIVLALSASQWERLLVGSGDAPTAGVVETVVFAIAWFVEATVPGGAMVGALPIAGLAILYTVFLEYWFVLALLLIVLSVVVIKLDEVTDEDLSVTLYPDRRESLRWIAISIGIVWAFGAVPMVYGQALESIAPNATQIGTVAGAGLSGVAFVVLASYGTVDLARRLVSRQSRPSDNKATVAAYLLARKVLESVRLFALPLLAYLAFQSVTTMALFQPVMALRGGPWWAALIIGLAFVVFGVWSVATFDRFESVRNASRRYLASGAIRSLVAARSVSVAAAVIGGLLGWAYLGAELATGHWSVRILSVLAISVITAAIAVVFVVIGRALWDRVGVMAIFQDGEVTPPTDQVVEVLDKPLIDGDGNELFAARVDGRPLVAREPETLLEYVSHIVETRFETGETPHLVAHEHYDQAVDRGVVSYEDVYHQVRGDISTRVTASLQAKNGIDQLTLEKELKEEYPDNLVEKVLQWLRYRGEIGIRDGKYVRI